MPARSTLRSTKRKARAEGCETIKIADFSAARRFRVPADCYTEEVGTLWYRAPELLLGHRQYTAAVDMWSLGCIAVEMVQNGPPFASNCAFAQLMRIFETVGTPSEKEWASVASLPYFSIQFPKWSAPAEGAAQRLLATEVKLRCESKDPLPSTFLDLVNRMLVLDPIKRITPQDALKHEFFAQSSSSLHKQMAHSVDQKSNRDLDQPTQQAGPRKDQQQQQQQLPPSSQEGGLNSLNSHMQTGQ